MHLETRVLVTGGAGSRLASVRTLARRGRYFEELLKDESIRPFIIHERGAGA
jgi:hypothetical protein